MKKMFVALSAAALLAAAGSSGASEELAIGVIEDYDVEKGTFTLRSGAVFERGDVEFGDLDPGDWARVRFERKEGKNITVGIAPYEYEETIGVINEVNPTSKTFTLRSGAEFEVGAEEDFEEFFGPVGPGTMGRVTFERRNGKNVARDVDPYELFDEE